MILLIIQEDEGYDELVMLASNLKSKIETGYNHVVTTQVIQPDATIEVSTGEEDETVVSITEPSQSD